jgi:hypothetical protein
MILCNGNNEIEPGKWTKSPSGSNTAKLLKYIVVQPDSVGKSCKFIDLAPFEMKIFRNKTIL